MRPTRYWKYVITPACCDALKHACLRDDIHYSEDVGAWLMALYERLVVVEYCPFCGAKLEDE